MKCMKNDCKYFFRPSNVRVSLLVAKLLFQRRRRRCAYPRNVHAPDCWPCRARRILRPATRAPWLRPGTGSQCPVGFSESAQLDRRLLELSVQQLFYCFHCAHHFAHSRSNDVTSKTSFCRNLDSILSRHHCRNLDSIFFEVYLRGSQEHRFRLHHSFVFMFRSTFVESTIVSIGPGGKNLFFFHRARQNRPRLRFGGLLKGSETVFKNDMLVNVMLPCAS